MTMVSFDTSYLLKCYVLEDASAEVRRLAAEREQVACCELGRLELVSALHRKLREHTIQAETYAVIRRQLASDERQGVWNWLSLSQDVLEGVYSVFHRLPLNACVRTGDAIHLECARRNGFSEIYSGDRHLLEAARHFGLWGRSVTS
jgi:predicted nucleic acid-binding protein